MQADNGTTDLIERYFDASEEGATPPEEPKNLYDLAFSRAVVAQNELYAALKDLYDWANAPFTDPPDDSLFERVEKVLAKYDPELPF